MNRISVITVLCMLVTIAPAQMVLTTTFTGGTGQSGNMFDIQATNAVEICSFDLNLASGAHDIEIYTITGGGTYVGNETNAAAWTLVGQITGLISAGVGVPTPCPIAVATTIPAGAIQGFYVTTSNGGLMWYTAGTTLGAVFASDTNITFLEGVAKSYPFGTTFSPRVWNGNINYTVGGGCPPPPIGEWQTNQVASSLTLNGLPDPGPFRPIIQSSMVGMAESLDLATTNVGAPWDIAILLSGSAVPLAGAGIMTAGGQVINMDLTSPGLSFINGGALPDLATTAFPATTFSIGFATPVPLTASAQMAVVDPGSTDGFTLSHAADYIAEDCTAAQNFDSLPTGAGSAPVSWTNPSAGGMPWTVNSGGTPSTATGPTAAAGGSNYMFCETSGGGTGSTFAMDTCQIDLTQIAGVTGTLNFSLSRIGATIGTLNIYIDDGSGAGFVPITDATSGLPVNYVGADPTQAQGATEWSAESIPFLHMLATSTVTIRFEYTAGTSFTGDLGIDSFSIN